MDQILSKYNADAKELMAQIEELASKPNPNYESFSAITRLASKGYNLDPQHEAASDIRMALLMTPCMLMLCIMFFHLTSLRISNMDHSVKWTFSGVSLIALIAAAIICRQGYKQWRWLQSIKKDHDC